MFERVESASRQPNHFGHDFSLSNAEQEALKNRCNLKGGVQTGRRRWGFGRNWKVVRLECYETMLVCS